MQQCAIGQFAVAEHDEQRIPLFVHRYIAGRSDDVEVFVTRRREVARLKLSALRPIDYSLITGGLVGFEAIHASYGKGVIRKEEILNGRLHVHILREGAGLSSEPVPIHEIALGPPRR